MKIEPAAASRGTSRVPGDKSLSHRAVLLAAVGEGETRISGFGRSDDTEATIKAVRASAFASTRPIPRRCGSSAPGCAG